MATVKIPPVLRAQTDGAADVSAGGATVGEVLSGLAEAHPRPENVAVFHQVADFEHSR